MKAIPSLFVGLAVTLAGCSWTNVQSSRPLGRPGVPQSEPGFAPVPQGPAPTPDTNAPFIPDPNALAPAVELGKASASPPASRAAAPSQASIQTMDDDARLSADLWHTVGESHERRPMQALRTGEGEQRIFVTGSFHGDDLLSVQLLDAIASGVAAEQASTSDSRFLILRSPNPDGLATAQRWNANGVDLNRNFPSLRFISLTNGRTGDAPASETETRNILRLLGDFQPDRVILIRTADIPAMQVFINPTAEPALGEVLEKRDIERGRFEEVNAVGSLEEFVSQRLHAETMTVLVPESMARRTSTVETLLTLCTGNTSYPTWPGRRPEGSPQPPIAEMNSPRGPAALTGILEPLGQDGSHGYVEFLPPPPETEDRSGHSGYYELPPPT